MRTCKSPLFRQLSLAALAAATLLVPTVALAGPAVPFKANIAITEVIQPDSTGACYLVGDITGSGQATHMGTVSLASHDCINPISQTEFTFRSDQVVLTAANGDQIFARYGGLLTVTIGAIAGGYQIVGGTGRFVHATGAGIVQGSEEINPTGPSKGQIRLIGTISY